MEVKTMGMSVFSEVNSDKYFSISTITREKMDKNGLKMTVKQLRIGAQTTAFHRNFDWPEP